MPATRDPERTKARILRAALREFSKKGFDGGRIDAIAASARVSVRMLYYYFGDKRALYQAVMHDRLSARSSDVQDHVESGGAHLLREFAAAQHDKDLARLLQWEALSTGSGRSTLVDEQGRKDRYAALVADFARRQRDGTLTTDVPPDMVLLLAIAVTIYPICFPQICRLIVGQPPNSEEFDTRFDELLTTIGHWLSPT